MLEGGGAFGRACLRLQQLPLVQSTSLGDWDLFNLYQLTNIGERM